ncbi:MAG: PEGA domain-containing protein [Myxococcota bacterium]
MQKRILTAAIPALLVTAWAPSARATKIASIVRGVGAGSDKAAGYVSYQIRRALQEDDRYEVVDLPRALGSPTQKRAERAFDVASEMLQKGRSAYETLDLDPAIEYLNTALAKYERHAAHVTDISKVADVLMLLGATHILRGEEKTGGKRLAQAKAIYPEVEPDPTIFNPGMRQIFDEAADRLAHRPLGTVSITSNPSYAEVYLDGDFVGVTPMAIDGVTEGRHFVRLVKDGYRNRGNVLNVVGQVEAADVATLKPTDSYEEFDALVEAATPSLATKEAGDRVGEVFRQLGVVLDVEQLMITEVRLDGERVRVMAIQIDVVASNVIKAAKQVFSYDSQPATYEREIEDLLRSSFAVDTLARKAGDGDPVAGDGGLVHAATGICYGMPCKKFKTLLLAIGGGGGTLLGLLGGVLDYLAYIDNGKYRVSAQPSQEAKDLRSAGTAKAIVGDILAGVGVAVAATSVVLYFVWEPAASTPADVIEQTDGSWGLAVTPLRGGAAVSAHFEF